MSWLHPGSAISNEDHPEVCQLTEISVATLWAWARIMGMNAETATDSELLHALDHFRLVSDAEGGRFSTYDALWIEHIHAELQQRLWESRDPERIDRLSRVGDWTDELL